MIGLIGSIDYYKRMKLLTALLVFMIAAQPVQAGFCGMGSSGDSGPHAAMQHDQEPQPAGHDCCQTPDSDGDQNCSEMPCGSCATGLQAVPLAAQLVAIRPVTQHFSLGEGWVSPSHTSPPFRPPISNS